MGSASDDAGFVAIMRGGLGAHPDIRGLVDQLRWSGARRILLHLGVAEPVPPVLRATMRGWVGYLDEITLDRLGHGDHDTDTLVELAAANLAVSLACATRLSTDLAVPPRLHEFLATVGPRPTEPAGRSDG